MLVLGIDPHSSLESTWHIGQDLSQQELLCIALAASGNVDPACPLSCSLGCGLLSLPVWHPGYISPDICDKSAAGHPRQSVYRIDAYLHPVFFKRVKRASDPHECLGSHL